MSVRIITDSASDITREKASELGVEILPMTTSFGEEQYLDGVTMSHEEFFHKLVETDTLPTTSQISPYDYERAFAAVREAKDTAVCITISAKLSGSYQSAVIAAADYEDCVTLVDSNNVCVGQQILVMLAVRLRDEGKTAEEIAGVLEEQKKNIRLIALLDTLEYLKKGGRISPAVAFAGNLLSIKPVIAIEDGEVVLLGKARGSRNSGNLLTKYIEEAGEIDFDMPYSLAYSGLSDTLLKKYVADSARFYQGHVAVEDLPVCTIGSTIGTHVGPGAIAVTFFKKN